jgi:hypothetical protein
MCPCAAREEAAAEKDGRGRGRDQAACARVARRVAARHTRGARTCARARARSGRGHRQPVCTHPVFLKNLAYDRACSFSGGGASDASWLQSLTPVDSPALAPAALPTPPASIRSLPHPSASPPPQRSQARVVPPSVARAVDACIKPEWQGPRAPCCRPGPRGQDSDARGGVGGGAPDARPAPLWYLLLYFSRRTELNYRQSLNTPQPRLRRSSARRRRCRHACRSSSRRCKSCSTPGQSSPRSRRPASRCTRR